MPALNKKHTPHSKRGVLLPCKAGGPARSTADCLQLTQRWIGTRCIVWLKPVCFLVTGKYEFLFLLGGRHKKTMEAKNLDVKGLTEVCLTKLDFRRSGVIV
jgi:hypothetical protein